MSSEEVRRYLSYISANVRKLRLRAGLTQEQLAEAADVDLTYLQRVERGSANPSVRVLVGLAVALGVTPAQLFSKASAAERRPGRPRRKA